MIEKKIRPIRNYYKFVFNNINLKMKFIELLFVKMYVLHTAVTRKFDLFFCTFFVFYFY